MTAAAINGIDSHTYLVKEPARATAFWRATMGLRLTWEAERGAEFELAAGASFGLWKMDDDSWMAGNGVMFGVPDIDAAVAHYRAKGVRIADHIEGSPVCRMAFGEDSEGNHFILQRKAAEV